MAAFRERLGRALSTWSLLTRAEVDATVVSRLHMPAPVRLADLRSGRATGFGITREIHTVTPYRTTRAWAEAFHTAGMGGVRYDARFSTGTAQAYAVFGDAGARPWPVDPTPLSGREVAAAARIAITDPPHSVRTITPPARPE